ncbi:hypothetical protein RI129_006307 [Pyrocoelia pectoralis]|uniref:NADH dehydrogenase [ubiquinone] 1 beta subcomplex subunit 6 n=1 Tax=Pyrocoelia pectoralis TaxID=417401 RepID=A0AAN7ZJL4_9COLE
MYKRDTGGARPMAIAGRFIRERERLIGMSDEERAWRKQWLKDQILSPNEPRHVPEMYKFQYNIFRRAYKAPLNILQNMLEPMIGKKAHAIRFMTGKIFLIYLAGIGLFYNLKYNQNDWTRLGGFRILQSRPAVLPGDPAYPQESTRCKPSDYASRGFDKVTLDL